MVRNLDFDSSSERSTRSGATNTSQCNKVVIYFAAKILAIVLSLGRHQEKYMPYILTVGSALEKRRREIASRFDSCVRRQRANDSSNVYLALLHGKVMER